ncbi:hypothetical protein [Ralstonia phage RSP15]|uniref:DprA-like DNA recombination-mediator protein n=1 Tax=Ralstonia phage RSP15 TaxID=1785960 RepID=UPI00074D2B5A|nr:DprA-like DNA recombination-mediator protein [Ralstonia phage RSP15]BAU40027.1 hypothetical protein [Ralstonia phage RSP15]
MIGKIIITGVGSRETPAPVLHLFTEMTKAMSHALGNRLTIRTGDASGADKAFRDAGHTLTEVYTPKQEIDPKCFEIAARIHPVWDRLNDYAKRLHARNIYQVVGKSMEWESDYLVCWTPNGEDIGGTRTAIKYAKELEIPVFNFAKDVDRIAFQDVLSLWGVDFSIPLESNTKRASAFFS